MQEFKSIAYEYGYDCYYRVGDRCKFYDWSPCEEPMACEGEGEDDE